MKTSVGTTIDEDLIKKIRKLQSQMIVKTNEQWSFSKILNMALEDGLREFKKKNLP